MGLEIADVTGEADASGAGNAFTFVPLPEDTAFASMRVSTHKDSLKKWDLEQHSHARAFRFDHAFEPAQADAFLTDFFASAAVQEAAPVSIGPGADSLSGRLGSLGPGAVRYARLPTTVLRLDFFDRLKDEGIVRAGSVSKCFDVQCGEVLVGDRLRKCLLDESSEEWECFSAAERGELIFHVMKRLAIGGGFNQYDDEIEPYLNLTKALYKDLVTVNKTAAGALQVSSLTFAVESVAGSASPLFPRPSPHNFCYVIVDPLAKVVKLWYSAWFPMM